MDKELKQKRYLRRGVFISLLIVFVLLVSACSQELVLQPIENQEPNLNENQEEIVIDSPEEAPVGENQGDDEMNKVETLTPIVIQMNDIEVTGTLNNTVTAQALKARLPFEISVSRATDDLCGTVSETLPSDPAEGQDAWHLGEIGWFGGWFTILLDHEENFSSMPGVMIIGAIDEEYIGTVADLHGRVDIKITLVEEEAVSTVSSKIPAFEEAPQSYFEQAEQAGSLDYFDYETSGETGQEIEKRALVYLPYGYDDSQEAYNILYLMHGGSGSENSWFGRPNQPTNLKKMIDHMIESGEVEPLIIVAPTYYREDSSNNDRLQTKAFQREFEEDLMPQIESHYRTYAETTSHDDLIASRDHRAFGGYSMGGVTTWYALEDNLDYIKYFMPMSGDSWTVEMMGGLNQPAETANALKEAIEAQGYGPQDFYIYASAGENDIAHDAVVSLMNGLETLPEMFIMTDDFSQGNLHVDIAPGHYHDYPYGYHNIYNALKTFFKTY